MLGEVESQAFDLVSRAEHPSPECGGPCATCAFRLGTQANLSEHTVALAKLCVEGISPFSCHEKPQLCRGWIAAVNVLEFEGLPQDEDSKRHREVMAHAADMLSMCISAAVQEQNRG